MRTSDVIPADEIRHTDDDRWAAVVKRDRAADGQFFYSVSSTGVFCRPSCGARLALRQNVRFHRNCDDAIAAGFRPCRRCKPDQAALHVQHTAMVAQSCRLIDNAESQPDLGTLAKAAGMSRYHFHRIFKSITGMTPKSYANAQRAERLRQELNQGGSVTAALYDAGFNSIGPFYETSTQTFGMTPSSFRAGGRDAIIRFAIGQSSLGAVLVAATDKGVCAILLGDDAQLLLQDLQDRFPLATLVGGEQDFEKTVALVVGMVEAPAVGLDLPLDLRGTLFQQRVWQALRQIPAGSTVSYTALASLIGSPKAVRAVASACAANPIAIAIPCHRVLLSDGALSGYRWGVDRKRALLLREQSSHQTEPI